MKLILKFILALLADERGELSLGGLATEVVNLNKKQGEFVKNWEDMKPAIEELIKCQKDFKEVSEVKDKLAKYETTLSKQEDTLAAMQESIKKIVEFKPEKSDETKEKEAAKFEKKAFEQYLRKGQITPGMKYELDGKILTVESKDFSIGVGSEGGVLVRPELATSIMSMLQDLDPIRKEASVRQIGSNRMEILEETGEMVTGWVAENAARPVTASSGFFQRYIDVFEAYAQPSATQLSIDDPFLDLEGWIKDKIGFYLGKTEGAAFVNGNGTTQPRGFLTYPAGTARGQIEQVSSGEAATLTDVSIPGLILLQNSINEIYGNGTKWAFNRKTRGALRLLKQDGKFIFTPGIGTAGENLILGDPYFMLASMPDVAAASLSVAYGNWKQGYQIADRFGLRLIRDNITVKGKILFYTTMRVGGDVLAWDSIKLLKTEV